MTEIYHRCNEIWRIHSLYLFRNHSTRLSKLNPDEGHEILPKSSKWTVNEEFIFDY